MFHGDNMEENIKIDGQLNINQKEILRLIMSSDKILKYLYYVDNSLDIPNEKSLTVKQKQEVKQNNIYEYRAVPDSDYAEVKTYISIEYGRNTYSTTGYRDDSNPLFVRPTINLYIITHKNIDTTKFNGSRVNAIEDCICDIFHKKIVIPSLGMSQLTISEPITINPNYIGRVIGINFVGKKAYL